MSLLSFVDPFCCKLCQSVYPNSKIPLDRSSAINFVRPTKFWRGWTVCSGRALLDLTGVVVVGLLDLTAWSVHIDF